MQALSEGLGQDKLGLRHGPFRYVYNQQATVYHTQDPAHSAQCLE